jgi:thymidylate synthase ThyX
MKKILRNLKHINIPLKSGGKVFVLNTGAVINAEAEAMLQALHSRSVGGIASHLITLEERGAEKFMSTFYVGYGHKSIGDCGTTTVFVEGISLLAAKALQDWKLYSGQESSTRYIDFTRQPCINPLNTNEGVAILEAWRSFYLLGVASLPKDLEDRFPIQEGENKEVYKKAIFARTFDIMRGFLPAGITTNIAWHMNLRQFSDELTLLRHHPLPEVRDIAETTEEALKLAHPNSFSSRRYPATETYNADILKEYYYDTKMKEDFALTKDTIDTDLIKTYARLLKFRPEKTELPRSIAECGTLQFSFKLDFGSFRDLQRHRAITQRMPLLTTNHGFHPWYLSELSPRLRKEALFLIQKQKKAITNITKEKRLRQYYTALGFNIANRITGDLHALTYLIELRSTRFVHPTLRERARQMAEVLEKRFAPLGLVLHLDPEPNRFDIKRGEHDIIAKHGPDCVV